MVLRIEVIRHIHVLRVGIPVLVAISVNAQKETFVPANDVSFKISIGRSNYKAGESISAKYRIENISHASLYVPQEWAAICPASPHLWAWFEDSSGKHFVPGYAGSCSASPKTIAERMSREAILLRPGEHIDGTFRLDTNLFGGLKPGAYRIEAGLSGWREDKFSDTERSELDRIGGRFVAGEVAASTNITLK